MRKIFLTVSLTLILTVSSLADGVIPISGRDGNIPIAGLAGNTSIAGRDGWVPISGVAGCENGLYYPETGECVVGLAPSNSDGKQAPVFSETSLIGTILSFRDMIF